MGCAYGGAGWVGVGRVLVCHCMLLDKHTPSWCAAYNNSMLRRYCRVVLCRYGGTLGTPHGVARNCGSGHPRLRAWSGWSGAVAGVGVWHAGPALENLCLPPSKIFHITRPPAPRCSRPYLTPLPHLSCLSLWAPGPCSVCCACAKSDGAWRLFCTSRGPPRPAGVMPCGLLCRLPVAGPSSLILIDSFQEYKCSSSPVSPSTSTHLSTRLLLLLPYLCFYSIPTTLRLPYCHKSQLPFSSSPSRPSPRSKT